MFFIIGGLFQLINSLAVAQSGWGWQAADGIIAFILGVLVLAQWPASGLWVIGLFIGIDLIFYGGAWIALALGCARPETGGCQRWRDLGNCPGAWRWRAATRLHHLESVR